MSDDMQPDIEVTLTVKIREPNSYTDEEPIVAETFTATVNTDANKYEMARRSIAGIAESTDFWLRRKERGR